MKDTVIKKLNKMLACKEAVKWAKEQPNKQAAWDSCERGEWLLWLLGKLSEKSESQKRKKLVLCACDCATLAIKHSRKNRKVCEKAIQTTRAWTTGKATIIEVRNAAAAADAAAAYYAAYYAAAAAASAAADAAYYGYAVYAAVARTKILKKCADIVRKHYPIAPKF